jgi:hypothetical protein
MTAFRAEFVEIQQVKTRSVYKIVLEIPAEQADAALAVLGGVPKPGAQVWVAVARLVQPDGARSANSEESEVAVLPRPAPSDLDEMVRMNQETGQYDQPAHNPLDKTQGERIRTRAVMLCKDRKFQEWICGADPEEDMENEATYALKRETGIQSRAELATNPEARKRFLLLEAQYRAEVRVGK